MARIVFGADYLEDHAGRPEPDQRELAARLGRHDARRGAGVRRGEPGDAHDAVHPGRRDGPGDGRRRLRPDAGRGARRDDLRPARPAGRTGRPRLVRQLDVDAVGRADVRDAEPALVLYAMAALARRLGVPFRSGGSLCASKIPDAQAAYESAATLQPTSSPGSTSSSTPPAGSRAGCRSATRSSSSTPTSAGWPVFAKGIDLSENGQALDAILGERAGHALPRQRPHPGQLRDRLLPLRASPTTTASSSGRRTARSTPPSGRTRSGSGCSAEYEEPPIDPGIDEALLEFIVAAKASMPDAFV